MHHFPSSDEFTLIIKSLMFSWPYYTLIRQEKSANLNAFLMHRKHKTSEILPRGILECIAIVDACEVYIYTMAETSYVSNIRGVQMNKQSFL